MSRTGATCSCCGASTTMEDIRFEGRAGRLGAVMTAVVDGPKGKGKEYRLSKQNYEDGMARSFQACHAALRTDGRLVVVFANKQPDAWETLVAALIRAGFVVNGSWPIQTEMNTRTHPRTRKRPAAPKSNSNLGTGGRAAPSASQPRAAAPSPSSIKFTSSCTCGALATKPKWTITSTPAASSATPCSISSSKPSSN